MKTPSKIVSKLDCRELSTCIEELEKRRETAVLKNNGKVRKLADTISTELPGVDVSLALTLAKNVILEEAARRFALSVKTADRGL